MSPSAHLSLLWDCPPVDSHANGRLTSGMIFLSQFLVLQQIVWASGFLLDLKEWPHDLWPWFLCLVLFSFPVLRIQAPYQWACSSRSSILRKPMYPSLVFCLVWISVKGYALKSFTMIGFQFFAIKQLSLTLFHYLVNIIKTTLMGTAKTISFA